MKKKTQEFLETSVTIRIEKSKLKELDQLAKKMKLTKSQLIRNMVNTSIDDLKLMNSTGLLTMALKGYDLLEVVKAALNSKKYQIEDEKLIIEL